MKRGLDAIGFYSGLKTGIALSDINYDIIDRDGWEPRSVDSHGTEHSFGQKTTPA
ncbi:MAG: hypothetical protein IPM69_14095 [Ignavibacteria bacterium]|nr:hypothetical protein [Ignavibacteria bacterium]